MSWKLWIDDQLNDPDCPRRHTPEGFVGAASCDEAIALVKEMGCPAFMDLDCDLADGKDVMTFLYWLEQNYHNDPPDWNVHSANIVATPNVNAFMSSWHKVLRDIEYATD